VTGLITWSNIYSSFFHNPSLSSRSPSYRSRPTALSSLLRCSGSFIRLIVLAWYPKIGHATFLIFYDSIFMIIVLLKEQLEKCHFKLEVILYCMKLRNLKSHSVVGLSAMFQLVTRWVILKSASWTTHTHTHKVHRSNVMHSWRQLYNVQINWLIPQCMTAS
jgi:hypothetical protein